MNRHIFKGMFLGALFLASPALVLTESDAQATSFAELSIEQFTDASSLIVEGTITETWTELNDEKQAVTSFARLSVTKFHKGSSANEIVISSSGGTHGSVKQEIPGMAKFSVGEEIFTFLHTTDDGRHLPVSKFLGKYTVRRAPGESNSYVRTWHPRSTDNGSFDHRFLPHPAPENRFYLDDIRTQVNARLDSGWDGLPIPGLSANKLEMLNTPIVRLRK